jgi:hypothetical protein
MRDQDCRAPGFRVFKHRQPSSLSEPSVSFAAQAGSHARSKAPA